nr:RWP-RK domain-containing protein [Tanacetum cinerariifolium]
YRLELDVSDDTGHTVVVLFGKPATALVKCSAESIAEADDEIDPIEGIEEIKGSSTLDADAGSHNPELKRLSQHISVPTPLKPSEEVNKIRVDIEDSDTEARGDSSEGDNKARIPVFLIREKKSNNFTLLGSPNDPTVNPSLSNMLHKFVFIQSHTVIGQDGRVQSYRGLKLADIHASESRPSHTRASKKNHKGEALTSTGFPAAYHNLSPPSYECSSCHAIIWYAERIDKAKRAINLTFSLCCQEGKVLLPRFKETPLPLNKLLDYNDATTSSNTSVRKMKRGYVIMKEYYAYIIQQRNNQGTTLLRGGRLFQQYLVDANIAIEEKKGSNGQEITKIRCMPLQLWEENWVVLSDDILHKKLYKYPDLQLIEEQLRNYCLLDIQELLNRHGKSLREFQELPQLNPRLMKNLDNRLIKEALAFDMNKRKTFLYKTIIARLRSTRMIILAVASS